MLVKLAFLYNYFYRILLGGLGLLVNKSPTLWTSTSQPFRRYQLLKSSEKFIIVVTLSVHLFEITRTAGYFVGPRVSNIHRYCAQCASVI